MATSQDLTPNGGLLREIPLFQANLGWWNIIILPDVYLHLSHEQIHQIDAGINLQHPPMDPYQKKTMATKTRRGRH